MTLTCPDTFSRYKILVVWSFLVVGLEATSYIFPSLIHILPAFPGNTSIILFVLAGVLLFGEVRLPLIWWLLISVIITVVVIISVASAQMTFAIFMNATIEELIFRLAIPVVFYFLLSKIVKAQLALWIAIFVSSGVFALVHSDVNLPTLLLGFLWCLIVWRGQSLTSVILSHTLMNLTILAHQTNTIPQPGYSILILVVLWTSILPIHYNQIKPIKSRENDELQRR